MNQKIIDKLISLGGSRWQKEGMDRIYFRAGTLGLDCEYYKTGNISSARFLGEYISNSEGNRMKAAKTYYNVVTEQVVSDNNTLRATLEKLVQG